jgi:hypothetical protein
VAWHQLDSEYRAKGGVRWQAHPAYGVAPVPADPVPADPAPALVVPADPAPALVVPADPAPALVVPADLGPVPAAREGRAERPAPVSAVLGEGESDDRAGCAHHVAAASHAKRGLWKPGTFLHSRMG